jgi:hypothetical protein
MGAGICVAVTAAGSAIRAASGALGSCGAANPATEGPPTNASNMAAAAARFIKRVNGFIYFLQINGTWTDEKHTTPVLDYHNALSQGLGQNKTASQGYLHSKISTGLKQ